MNITADQQQISITRPHKHIHTILLKVDKTVNKFVNTNGNKFVNTNGWICNTVAPIKIQII